MEHHYISGGPIEHISYVILYVVMIIECIYFAPSFCIICIYTMLVILETQKNVSFMKVKIGLELILEGLLRVQVVLRMLKKSLKVSFYKF